MGLNQAIERLTTGRKINHAKDNAANYSISTKLGSKLSSYFVAQDNAAMGLDMLTTAMDSLDLVSNHLSRMRDLAEQAANDTYGANSLKAIQSETEARLAECNRTLFTAEYNKVKLFQQEPEVPEPGGSFIEEIKPLSEAEALAQGYTIIKTAEELQAMENDLSGKYILMDNIDLAGYDWTAVGATSNFFTGEFNGNGHIIENLKINSPDKNEQGLFGSFKGLIKNVGIVDVDITGSEHIGALCGASYGEIYNCYSTGKVTGLDKYTGGLAGRSQGSIDSCYSTADVYGETVSTGGLVGLIFYADKTINSYATGNVTSTDGAGGFVGEVIGITQDRVNKIENCYATGNVSGKNLVGGFAGWLYEGNVENCFSSGNVVAHIDSSVGGFVGRLGQCYSNQDANIINCFTVSTVSTYGVVTDPYVGYKTGAFVGYQGSMTSISASKYYNTVNPGLIGIGGGNLIYSDCTDGGSVPAIKTTPLKQITYKVNQSSLPNIIDFQVGVNSMDSSQIVLDLSFGLNLSLDLSSAESARNAIMQIDEYLKQINEKQTEFGSAFNRLESALETIGVSIDNLTSTQSTIRDADVAKESSAYIRNQILQQASATLMSTAKNLQLQNILGLISNF